MRNIFLILVTVIIISGCNDSDNGYTNYPISDYDPSVVSLYTMAYFMPTVSTDDMSERGQFTLKSIKGDINEPINTLQAKKKITDPHILRQIELSEAMKGIKHIKNKPSLKMVPPDISVGYEWKGVYISRYENLNEKTYELINAKCIAVSKYAYFFLEEGLDENALDIDKFVSAIDTQYEVMLDKFGTPLDLDGNGKVIFLFTDMNEEISGYFSPIDTVLNELAETIGHYSNEGDMLYLNYNVALDPISDIHMLSTLFHELQHLIHYTTRVSNYMDELDLWINEGLSMLAMYYAGYVGEPGKEGATDSDYIYWLLLDHGSYSLTNFTTDGSYGYSLLFMRYLHERFGHGFIKDLYNSEETGVHSIEEVTGMDFNELFSDFMKMMFLTGRGITDDPRYNIPNFNYSPFTDLDSFIREGFNMMLSYDVFFRDFPSYIKNGGESFSVNDIAPYSFFLFKWKGKVTDFYLNYSGNVKLLTATYKSFMD